MPNARLERNRTYSSDYSQTIVAALNHIILHRPCPVPMNLECRVAINKNKLTRGELLVSKVGSAMHQYHTPVYKVKRMLLYPKFPPTNVKSARKPPEPFSM